MLIFNNRTCKSGITLLFLHMKFIFILKRLGLYCVNMLISRINFFSSLEWKHKRIEFVMKNIYILLRCMKLCVCITDYDDIQKRTLKDFWQLFRMQRRRLRNNIQWIHKTKNCVFNVRFDNYVRTKRDWQQSNIFQFAALPQSRTHVRPDRTPGCFTTN
jgi:hypothetical protein